MNKNQKWNIENSYSELPSCLFVNQLPEQYSNPTTKYFNTNLALDLGLQFLSDKEILDYFSGNLLPVGAKSISQAYAGHQFGNFTMLGDGRAVLLCEQITPKNKKYDIQLKGSGKTPFSRRGDGKATLSSVLREFLISEAMYYLGVPTSRSLAVIQTGQKVYREKPYDGGILTRVSSSHIRFGTFEYLNRFCSNEELLIFSNYVIDRHYPHVKNTENPYLSFIEAVMIKQIDLVIHWMRIGFIHGVMNTDNMSIFGETIDYGPCAFMNIYDPKTVFSSIDRGGRYAFGNQPDILYWNLIVLVNALLPLLSNDKKKSIDLGSSIIDKFSQIFTEKWYNMMLMKLGISNRDNDDKELVDLLLEMMIKFKSDYTNTFAALTLGIEPEDSSLLSSDEFKFWKKRWTAQVDAPTNKNLKLDLMKKNNPISIPRNHLVESALKSAVNGNFSEYDNLLNLIKNPYNYKSNNFLQIIPEGFDDSYKTFCGT